MVPWGLYVAHNLLLLASGAPITSSVPVAHPYTLVRVKSLVVTAVPTSNCRRGVWGKNEDWYQLAIAKVWLYEHQVLAYQEAQKCCLPCRVPVFF